MKMRLEKDSVGELDIPIEAYYGVHTLRANHNFAISQQSIHPFLIKSLIMVKQAAAQTNKKAGELTAEQAQAIQTACQEIQTGRFDNQFIVDAIQGGAGTSTNMNINEVIANRAIELLGGEKGDYSIIHPNDHVNCAQSTNDVYPTAGKLAVLQLISSLDWELRKLEESFQRKAKEFQSILKIGRTQLQDAVQMTLGDTFRAYASATKRSRKSIERTADTLKEVNLAGTAIGNSMNASDYYKEHIIENLNEISNFTLTQAEDLFDATQNLDPFIRVSSELKACGLALSKISNDLRLLASGPRAGIGEINLPVMQNGSSIMPGKVNPVIPEVVSQIAYKIAGNDTTISMAAESGQLELNAFEPVIFQSLFESIEWMTRGVRTLRKNCIEGISANEDVCREQVESSLALATTLSPIIGYQKAAELAKEAHLTGRTIKEVVIEKGWLTESDIHQYLSFDREHSSVLFGK